MRDPGCDNDSVSPTPAEQAQAARIARELIRTDRGCPSEELGYCVS